MCFSSMTDTVCLGVGFIVTQGAFDYICCLNSIGAVAQSLVSLQELPVVCRVGTLTALVPHKVTNNVPLAFRTQLATYPYYSVSNPLV